MNRYGYGFVVLVLLAAAGLWYAARPAHPTRPHPTTPAEALAALRDGNDRYTHSRRSLSTDTARDADDRHELARGQHPFAAVLTCSDSRLCPEFIFDQKAGSMFEVRNAGNLVDEDVLASFEYAAEHLHVPLFVVLGHKGCGAIEAVHRAGPEPLHDHLKALQLHTNGMRQEFDRTRDDHSPACLNRLSAENARLQARALVSESAPIRAAVASGRVWLVHALYDMETGVVEFSLPVPPAP